MRGWKVATALAAINWPNAWAELKALKQEPVTDWADLTAKDEPDSKQDMDSLKKQLEDEKRSRLVQEAAATEAIRNVTEQMQLRRQAEKTTAETRSRLDSALHDLAEEKNEVKDLREALQKQGNGTVAVWLVSSHWQWTMALLAALVGMFGLVGTDALVIAFHSLVGSLLTGLLLAGSVGFLGSNLFGEGTSWLDANDAVLNGAGSYTSYFVWLVTTCLSLFRWRSNIPVILFAQVETLHLNTAGEITEEDCQQPLLGATTWDPEAAALCPRLHSAL
ncbi:unnamed protein product [Cladocopium goreaui]|uniref:Uncharacterized protein n=1 Tax=Cladocopium goreaui TaxID=2562237 RepID=A0A9P1BUV1_9DINO|nr:unnamed protein product [Cladocopium goreaui]